MEADFRLCGVKRYDMSMSVARQWKLWQHGCSVVDL